MKKSKKIRRYVFITGLVMMLIAVFSIFNNHAVQQIEPNSVTNCDKMIPKDIQTWESSYIEEWSM